MTVPVKVRYGENEILSYALLDSGSQRTFCSKKLAKELKAEDPREMITLNILSSGSRPKSLESKNIFLSVKALDEDRSTELSNVLVVDEIPLKVSSMPTKDQLEKFDHLRGLDFKELPDKTVGILIGLDAPLVFRSMDSRFGPQGTPDAIKTVLGWVLFGPALTPTNHCENRCRTCMHVSLPVDPVFNLDAPPHNHVISCGLEKYNSREDRLAHQVMKDSVRVVNGHFQLPLLWRRKDVRLPSNRSMVERRLKSLKNRLSKNEELRSRYAEVMQSYLERGYAEEVGVEACDDDERAWFLPHHPVVNPRKPEKTRIVIDCAAKFMGASLNDMLMQGPDLMCRLTGVLTRFRLNRVALVADIEAMFHRVKVNPEVRCSFCGGLVEIYPRRQRSIGCPCIFSARHRFRAVHPFA